MEASALELVGLTQEELQERVVQKLSDRILAGGDFELLGDDYEANPAGEFTSRMRTLIKGQVDKTIQELFEENVQPNIGEYIEGVTLQATNQWGEERGEKLTFKEYLVHRAQAYLTEKVDFEGKSRGEVRSSYGNWRGEQTRIAHLIHKHLHYSIETAMKAALKEANSAIAEGIVETAKIKLTEISERLKVKVEVPR